MDALHFVHGFLEILLPNRENVVDIVARLCVAAFFFLLQDNTHILQHNNTRSTITIYRPIELK